MIPHIAFGTTKIKKKDLVQASKSSVNGLKVIEALMFWKVETSLECLKRCKPSKKFQVNVFTRLRLIFTHTYFTVSRGKDETQFHPTWKNDRTIV